MGHHEDRKVGRRTVEEVLEPFHLRVVEEIIGPVLRSCALAVQEYDPDVLAGHVIPAVGLSGGQVEVLPRPRLPGFLEKVRKVVVCEELAFSGIPVVIARSIEPYSVVLIHLGPGVVHDLLGISRILLCRIRIEPDVSKVDYEIGSESLRRSDGMADVLVGETAAGVDVCYDGKAHDFVVTFPFRKSLVSLIDLGLDEIGLVGRSVLVFQKMVVQFPPTDGGSAEEEIDGLSLVVVEIFKPEDMLPLRKRLRRHFGDRSVGSVVVDQEFPVDVEPGAVV